MSLTSLIDVIFLLLLFFMLSSTFSRFAEVELAAAAPGGTGAEERPLFLRLTPAAVTLNGDPVALAGLAVAIPPTAQAPRTVLVSLAPEVTSQRLTDLLAALRGVPDIAPVVLGGGG